jgi:hypothetical protein
MTLDLALSSRQAERLTDVEPATVRVVAASATLVHATIPARVCLHAAAIRFDKDLESMKTTWSHCIPFFGYRFFRIR